MYFVITWCTFVKTFVMQTGLKKIGNSYGVILNKKLLGDAGISITSEITIKAENNAIVISPTTGRRPLNRDMNTWRKQIKQAIKKGHKPAKNVWGNTLSEQEEQEWTW